MPLTSAILLASFAFAQLRFFRRALAAPRRVADLAFAPFAAFAGNTAMASISNNAPGRANCEIATVVLAGGAAMLKC